MGAKSKMSWQDIPLKAINFTSFWLSNEIKFGRHTLIDLFEYAKSNNYNIEKTVLLGILEKLISLKLVDVGREIDEKMTFSLNIYKSSDLIAQYKKANF